MEETRTEMIPQDKKKMFLKIIVRNYNPIKIIRNVPLNLLFVAHLNKHFICNSGMPRKNMLSTSKSISEEKHS